ncbi:kelch repeat and BTB domain-containing protein 2-like [Oculina patagonica]
MVSVFEIEFVERLVTFYVKAKSKRFSEPWMLSDAVLVVENQKLHVHRSILALCSTVFEDILTTSNAEEISLPGLNADEVREMLHVIYPHVPKDISDENCVCLLELAHKYQMKSLLEKCEDYLKSRKNSPEEALHLILLAQLFNMSEDFIQLCIQVAKRIPLSSLKASEVYGKLNPPIARELRKESVCYWGEKGEQAHILDTSLEKKILYLEAKKIVREDRKRRLSRLKFELTQKKNR